MAKLPEDVINEMYPETAAAAPSPSSYAGDAWIAEAEAADAQQPRPDAIKTGSPVTDQGQQPPANEEGNQGEDELAKLVTVPFGDFVRDFKPLEWLIYGYVQKNALEMLFGPSGSGKSFVVLDMALHIAVKKMIEDADQPEALSPRLDAVRKWHGQSTHGGRILYVAGEGVTGMKKRALAWVQQYGFNPDAINDYFRFSENPFHLDSDDDPPAMIGEWNKLLRELEILRTRLNFIPDLIIFDTLKANMYGEENSAKESGAVIDRAQELVKGVHTDGHGTTVLFVHHTGWNPEAKTRGRGSSAWRGAVDIDLSVGHGVMLTTPSGAPVDVMGTPGESREYLKEHFAVIDCMKVKDDEQQPRLFLKRKRVNLLDERGFPIPGQEEGKLETTLILETFNTDEDTLDKIHLDGEEEKPQRNSASTMSSKAAKGDTKPPAKEESSPEDLTPDDLALPGMEEALSSDSSGVKSFAQLKKREQGGKR